MERISHSTRGREISLSAEEHVEPAEIGWASERAQNSKNRDKFFKRKIKNNRQCDGAWILIWKISVGAGRIDREITDFKEKIKGWWDKRLIWSYSSDFPGR